MKRSLILVFTLAVLAFASAESNKFRDTNQVEAVATYEQVTLDEAITPVFYANVYVAEATAEVIPAYVSVLVEPVLEGVSNEIFHPPVLRSLTG